MKTLNRRVFLLSALLCLLPLTAWADRTVLLSALDLSKATQGYGKPLADKTVDGHPMTLKGQVFAHGFGTHTPGLLAIDLAGKGKRFSATVGVDDEVGPGQGQAQFQIWGDRKPLWKSRVLHSGDTPQAVDVDVAGVSQLLLRVTTAGASYNFGHADWADAKFQMTDGGVTDGTPQTVAFTPEVVVPAIAMAPPPDAPQIHPPFVVGIRPGTPLLWTVPVTGQRPLTFSAKRLPKGLILDSHTGLLTGTLPSAGDYQVHLFIRNGTGTAAQTVHVIAGDAPALTPPLGWNSYDGYGDSVTEAETLANAAYVAQKMQPYGWDTIVVDYRWYDPGAHDNNANARAGAALVMDGDGRLLPAPNRFPSAADGHGFQALAAKVHSLGLHFGIHIMRGIPRNAVAQNLPIEGSNFHAADAADTDDKCPWCPDMYGVRGDTAAGKAYYDSLFRLYAGWGVDFVKMDDTSQPYHPHEIEAVHAAILKCGRSIVYSLSPGETPLDQAAHVAAYANQWRVSGDFWDDWSALDHEFTLGANWRDAVGPGHWPDADMLPVGHLSVGNRSVRGDRRTQFTQPEQMTLLSLWALLPSPLMVGAALPDNDPWTLALLTNADVLAINQDALGKAGRRLSQSDEAEVWVKDLADGSKAVALFNRSLFSQPITLEKSALGLSGRWAVRDLWQGKSLGDLPPTFTATVPPHGVVLLRVSTQRSP